MNVMHFILGQSFLGSKKNLDSLFRMFTVSDYELIRNNDGRMRFSVHFWMKHFYNALSWRHYFPSSFEVISRAYKPKMCAFSSVFGRSRQGELLIIWPRSSLVDVNIKQIFFSKQRQIVSILFYFENIFILFISIVRTLLVLTHFSVGTRTLKCQITITGDKLITKGLVKERA